MEGKSKSKKKKAVRYFSVEDDAQPASDEEPHVEQVPQKKKRKRVPESERDVETGNEQPNKEESKPQRKQTDDQTDEVEIYKPDTSLSSLMKHKRFGDKFQERGKKGKLHKKKRLEEMAKVAIRTERFQGSAPIPEDALQKFKKDKIAGTSSRSSLGRYQMSNLKKKQTFSQRQAARLEVHHQEEAGYIMMDSESKTSDLTQDDIKNSVDLQSSTKRFDLTFDHYGSYRVDYTRTNRYLLFAGSLGHVASIDWLSKRPMAEMNVMETIHDTKWFHNENYFAVAQKRWTYIYDNSGIEIHCLKSLDCVLRMEFLPYSFLLACGHAKGFLSFLDVSIGQLKAGHSTHKGRLDVMGQNPAMGTIHLGHTGGVVSIWSPTVKSPLVEILCHPGPVTSVTVDPRGWYMATSGVDRKLKIWDLRMPREPQACRNYGCLQTYRVDKPASSLAFSQTGMLAAGIWKNVKVFKDCCLKAATEPYIVHRLPSSVNCPENGVTGLQFCPFEDVLGVGHRMGVSSLLVPGAGEPNFDALEANPYSTKRHRQHAEVHMLLEKVPAELLGDDLISKVERKEKEDSNPYFLKKKTKSAGKSKLRGDEGPLARFQRR